MAQSFTDKVWMYSKSTRGSRMILLALALYADDTGYVTIDHDEISRLTKLSSKSISVAMNKLIALGEVKRIPRGGFNNINAYSIHLTK